MGQLLHGSATTTEAVRRAIQHSQESLRRLAQRYGINPKTVTKWKKRASVADLPTGPREPRSTALSVEGEAVIVAFRRYKPPSLDSRLYALQPTIPHLARSSPHRCPQRHGIGRLPDVEDNRAATKKMESYPSGYFHIDIVEVGTEQGKPHMFGAIDRTSKLAFVELHEKAPTAVSKELLLRLIRAVPYKIHTALTGNGSQLSTPGASGSAVPLIRQAIATAKHPWTNGQVERMNRTIKDATVKRYTTTATTSSAGTSRTSSTPIFRAPAQTAERAYPVQIRLQMLDRRAAAIHPRSDPSNGGTEHLGQTWLSSSGEDAGDGVARGLERALGASPLVDLAALALRIGP